MYGRACNMAAISKIARDHDLAVIEDCAQACGCSHSGKRLGSFGRGAIFSLGPFKHVCALGAGMVVTNEAEIADKISSYVSQFPRLGSLSLIKRVLFTIGVCSVTKPLFWNFLMVPILRLCHACGFDLIEQMTTESSSEQNTVIKQTPHMPRPLQGAVGMSQLAKLDDCINRRAHNGNKLLENLQGVSNIKVPASAPSGENVFLSFAIQVNEPDQFRRRMLLHGIDTHPGDKSFVPYISLLAGDQECIIARNAIYSMVHLPVYPQLNESEIIRIAEAVQFAAHGNEE